jgi:hypothetical protein
MLNKALLSAVASAMLLVAAMPAAHADVWTVTLSGRMTSLSGGATGNEQLTYRWDPSAIVTGSDLGGPFARGPLLGAEWQGLINGSGSGGTLSAQVFAFFASLESGGAVTELGDIANNTPAAFWANPVPVTRTLLVRGGVAELFGGVPGGMWGDSSIRPTFQQTASLDIAPIPEPSTSALVGTALLALLGARRSRARRKT